MFPLRYVELCSQYRNRQEFPNPSNFTVEVNSNVKAIDPVCNSSPILYWNDSFNETENSNFINLTNLDITFSTTDNNIVQVTAPQNTLRALDKFYNGAVLSINTGENVIPYVTDGLVMNLDARDPLSYPGTGIYWYDISGNANHATLYNQPTFLNDREGLFFNSALSSYAQVPNNSLLNPTTDITLETYVYTKKINSSADYQEIIRKGFSTFQYSLTQNLYNVPTFCINGILNLYNLDTAAMINPITVEENTWYHIVGTYTVGRICLYINNILSYTTVLDPPPTLNVTTEPLYIGGISNGTNIINNFAGNILLVRLYNKALNATEVLQNYTNIVKKQELYLRRRIRNYTYLSTTQAELVLYPPPLPDKLVVLSALIEKPIGNTTTDTVPRFFIPRGENIDNYYIGYYLQNLDLGEARKIIAYDAITHLATLEDNTTSSWLLPYEWSWEAGPSTVNTIIINTPNPRYNTQNWMDNQNRLWLYGGVIYDPTVVLPFPPLGSDLWLLTNNTSWTQVSTGGGYDAVPIYGTLGVFTPGSRANALTWTDLQGRLWLHGGEAPQNTGIYADTWMYDGTAWFWMGGNQGVNVSANYGVLEVPATTNSPGSRYNTVTWVSNGDLWLYGGWNGAVRKSDIWRFKQETDGNYYWTWMNGSNGDDLPSVYIGPGINPGCRGRETAFWYSQNSLWIYGGEGSTDGLTFGYIHDLWKWDGLSWTYIFGTQTLNEPAVYNIKGVSYSTNTPGTLAMIGTYNWIDTNGNLWLFGGTTNTATPTASMWNFNITTYEWTWVQGPNIYVTDPSLGTYNTLGIASPTSQPGARNSGVTWVDVYGNFWLYGGQGYGEVVDNPTYILTDIWKFRLVNSNFTIRKQIPYYGRIISSLNYLLQIQNDLPPPLYTNAYLRIIGNKPTPLLGYSINPSPYAEERAIYNYNPSTALTEVRELFTSTPIGLSYELLPFTLDNVQPLVYPYDKEGNTVYDVRLVSLRIPHLELTTGYGGTVLDYPFLYVTIQNFRTGSGGSNTLVYSNSPNATNTTFCASTSDTSYIEGAFVVITNTDMIQRIQINPRNKLLVRVTLPNGELLSFVEQEYYAPTEPNPNIQISFLFEFRKLS